MNCRPPAQPYSSSEEDFAHCHQSKFLQQACVLAAVRVDMKADKTPIASFESLHALEGPPHA